MFASKISVLCGVLHMCVIACLSHQDQSSGTQFTPRWQIWYTTMTNSLHSLSCDWQHITLLITCQFALFVFPLFEHSVFLWYKSSPLNLTPLPLTRVTHRDSMIIIANMISSHCCNSVHTVWTLPAGAAAVISDQSSPFSLLPPRTVIARK
jgi:hypothetical protein